jgi:hypothetical protein
MKTTKKEHLPLYIRFREKMDKVGKDDFVIRSFETNPAVKSDSVGDRSIIFTVSSPGVKRDGHEIVQDGWRLENYRTNPVVMWAHSRDTLPIATSSWEKLVETASGRVLRSQADFLSAEDNQFADQVLSLYKKRLLNAVSAGWRALKYDFVRDEEDFVTGIRFLEQDLMEYSAVPIPADPQALQRSGVWTPDFINNLMRDAFDKSDESPLYLDVAAEDEAALERKIIVDLGENKPDTEVVDVRGKVDEWAKSERLEAIAQRLQQGVLNITSEEIPPMKEYLASHYTTKEQKAPWDTASGLVYESIHGLLKDEKYTDEAERSTLRESAESIAVQIYGEERLPEPWQNPYQNCVDGEKMQRIAAALDGQLLAQIPDVMSRESTVRKMAEIIQKDFEDEIEAVAVLNSIRQKVGTESYEEVCAKLDSLLTLEREIEAASVAPAPTPPATEEKPEVTVSTDTQEVRDAVERIEKLFTKNTETPLTTESELRSIFSTILSDAPVAGK